jgi:NADH-quinone oxidoreductase subunit E
VNELQEKYRTEIKAILGKYPDGQKRSAVMPLLYLAQRQGGYVSKQDLIDVGEICDLTATEVSSIVGFYTLYHDEAGGKYRVQVCNDLPCAMRGADTFLHELCGHLEIGVGETTEDGLVTVEAVMCLAACDKAPMFQVQDYHDIKYHENQTVESALRLINDWRWGEGK